MHIQNNITPVTSQKYVWHPITNKLYSLNCWYYSVVYAKSRSQFIIFVSFPQTEIEIPCSYNAPLSNLTSCTPTKSHLYLANSLATVVSEPHLYRFLSFHAPNLMSLFQCLRRTNGSFQARGACICFVTKPVFGHEESLSPWMPSELTNALKLQWKGIRLFIYGIQILSKRILCNFAYVVNLHVHTLSHDGTNDH